MQVFKYNIINAIFIKKYILNTILAILQKGMKNKKSFALHVFESAIIYFNSSLHLYDRLIKEYK